MVTGIYKCAKCGKPVTREELQAKKGGLVNRKVYLVRIDSKLGKSMELEGYLSADGKRIRGTWLNFELAGREGATGQWSATRRPSSP